MPRAHRRSLVACSLVARSLALLAGAALALPSPARAWDDTGHMTVAMIAWRHMSAAARRQAVALLRAAPASAGLRDVGRQRFGQTMDADQALFVAAASWPDFIRDPGSPGHALSRPGWHFIDQFWRAGRSGPEPDPALRPQPQNAAERLALLVPSLGTTVAAGSAAAALPPGVRLAWVIHLTGDIHQPLHAASRVTTAHPQGDRGGNLVLLVADARDPAFRELHAYWDHILDTAIPVRRGEAKLAYLARVADRVERDHPAASLAPRLGAAPDFGQWARDGLATAERQAYAGLRERQRPDSAYQAATLRAAGPAVALAGYRLADMLNRAFR
jgi:hypothetical protein